MDTQELASQAIRMSETFISWQLAKKEYEEGGSPNKAIACFKLEGELEKAAWQVKNAITKSSAAGY